MRFVQKSIIRKLFLSLILFALLMAALVFYFFYTGTADVPFYVFLSGLGIFVIYFLLIYYFDVIKPMRVVLGEIQALLSGKTYRRIYTDRVDEIGIIAHFFNKVTKGLGEVSHNILDRERILDELSIASELQREILPKESLTVPGLQIVAKNKPASELGGDSFDYITNHDKTYIYVGDVSGHGAAAGLIMTMVNSFVEVFADKYNSAYDILVNLNRYIKDRVRKTMFMTMVMLCWDHKLQRLTYVGAGHEHLIVYRGKSGQCEAILSGGVALGMVPDNSKIIKEKELDLEDGDFVILYTDGITEAKNEDGELYGLDRLKKAVIEYAQRYGAEGVNNYIAKDVSSFSKGTPQEDDMTLIVIQKDSSVVEGAKIKDPSTEWKV